MIKYHCVKKNCMQEGFEAINSALSSVDRKQVKGIGISGQQHGFVPVDSKGQVPPFYPAFVTACTISWKEVLYIQLKQRRVNFGLLCKIQSQLSVAQNGDIALYAYNCLVLCRYCLVSIEARITCKLVQVIRNAKLWCDVESSKEASKLSAEWDYNLVPGFTASKILWLKENEPENFEKLAKVLLPHDYINWYLTGRYVAEVCDSSLLTIIAYLFIFPQNLLDCVCSMIHNVYYAN